MTALTWVAGLLRRRRARLLATAIGVALAVALVASLGAFLSSTTAKMTQRAIGRVAVDWQVELAPGAAVSPALSRVTAFPGVRGAEAVGFASTPGLQAIARATVQTTGAGQVVGLPDGYASAFPGEIRVLSGSGSGVLLAQQTAANLHARPGDTVVIARAGRRPASVRVDGVVDLPQADSLFQTVGAAPGSQPQAPPDNVVLLPRAVFDRIETTAHMQIHVRLDHHLPASPAAAFDRVAGEARNLELRLAGAGRVGDNLGSALDGARQDALYAQLLFLFLGVPGAIIAGLLTVAVAGLGAQRRRHEQALLRTRGAATRQLVRIAAAETLLAGGLGVALGLGGALLIGHLSFGTASFGAGPVAAALWAAGSAAGGLAVAAAAIALPAWHDARALTVTGQRAHAGRARRAPAWQRWWLDLLALAGAGLVYWQASQNGYQLVLVPEGVPQVSVDWLALLAPALGWIGGGLFVYRLADLALRRGRIPLARLLRPLAGPLSPTVVSSIARERRLLARALTLVALTAAFAASTSVFNATYNQQSEVDARLTNGADVTAVVSPGAGVGPAAGAALRSVAGVASVEPLQHRYAYVGADLQDLYGVRPRTIAAAGRLQDSWFAGGSASALIHTLAARPDGVLVSQETVRDYQLAPGDLLRLRLQDARTHAYVTVPFHYVGVGKEFPTAPRDSFLVANASYIARMTGSDAVGTFLIQTDGAGPASVARGVRASLGPAATVTDIVDQRRVVGSNLTAVELSGLTRVELAVALILVIGATGLTLAVSFRERRRTFAIIGALGARRAQLGGFVWGESLFVAAGGLLCGAAGAAALSVMLVKILTGVFDPPPDVLSIPWGYLLATAGAAAVAVIAAGAITLRALTRPAIQELRDL
jgi:putative ABC transport system permease protein